jgi:branched-subunit amino acid aminotransferase/4-amino-4-deoxychorismate lyase
VGIVILVTPGRVHGTEPTRIIHASELPWKGCGSVSSGPRFDYSDYSERFPTGWPVHIKMCSRLHYYLADQQAAQAGPHAGAVMLGTRGQVTPTSFANVMMVNAQAQSGPSTRRCFTRHLAELLLALASRLGINVRFENISCEMFQSAREIILTGTNGGVWGARSLDGVQRPEATEDSVLTRLQRGWKSWSGFPLKRNASPRGHVTARFVATGSWPGAELPLRAGGGCGQEQESGCGW